VIDRSAHGLRVHRSEQQFVGERGESQDERMHSLDPQTPCPHHDADLATAFIADCDVGMRAWVSEL